MFFLRRAESWLSPGGRIFVIIYNCNVKTRIFSFFSTVRTRPGIFHASLWAMHGPFFPKVVSSRENIFSFSDLISSRLLLFPSSDILIIYILNFYTIIMHFFCRYRKSHAIIRLNRGILSADFGLAGNAAIPTGLFLLPTPVLRPKLFRVELLVGLLGSGDDLFGNVLLDQSSCNVQFLSGCMNHEADLPRSSTLRVRELPTSMLLSLGLFGFRGPPRGSPWVFCNRFRLTCPPHALCSYPGESGISLCRRHRLRAFRVPSITDTVIG